MNNTFGKLLASMFLSATAGMTVYAAPLSPDAALRRALGDSETPARAKSMLSARQHRLVYTAKSGDTAGCYVFETQGGSLIVSADDRALPVLGYTDGAAVDDEGNPAPGMAYWLEWLSAEIASAKESKAATVFRTRTEKSAIEPMVKTRWNQGAPYNDKCPKKGNDRSVTGCVATSMAQVVKYYGYPATGIGKKSYSWNGTYLNFNYAKTTFDYPQMLDRYDASATEEECNAVATLMYACGVGVEMNYSPSASGASSGSIAPALIKYFGYSESAHLERRDYYLTADWEDMVYEQLKKGPLIYDGQSSSGGHSFICDGYDGEGYFHFNWGWGGMSDGYYSMSALDPINQGIGGSTEGFDFSQDFVADLVPEAGGEPFWQIGLAMGMTVAEGELAAGAPIKIDSKIQNLSTETIPDCVVGLRYENPEGESTYVGATPFKASGLKSYDSIEIETGEIPADGLYKLYPVFNTGGEWHDILTAANYSPYAYLEVSEGVQRLHEGPESDPVFDKISLDTPIYYGSDFKMSFSVTNEGERPFYGPLTIGVLSGPDPSEAELVALSQQYLLDLEPEEHTEFEFITGFRLATQAFGAGTWYLATMLQGGGYYLILDMQEVEILPSTAIDLRVQNFSTWNGVTADLDPDNLEFKGTLTCEGGVFGGIPYMYIWEYGSTSASCRFASEQVFLNEGESAEMHFAGAYTEGVAGKTYVAQVLVNGEWEGEQIYLTFAHSSVGIDGVEEPEVERVEHYTLSGLPMEPGTAKAGTICIERKTLSDGKIVYKKTVLGK